MKCNIKGCYVTSLIVACLLCMTILASSVTAGAATSGAVTAVASSAKASAIKFAEDNAGITVDIAKSLWEYAEIGLAEYKSYVKARDVLAGAGFVIKQSAAGIPTCLVATWGSGQPVLGIYEDIDALPGVGHGCGHNLNTAAGVVAAMAIKSAMELHQIPGTIKVFLNPAEEIWDVAPLVAAAGYYDDVDVLLSFHAGTENVSEFGSTMAMDHVEYRFKGKAAHASAAPEKGLSALDAVEIMNIAVNFLREHLIQEMRIHYVITDGGAAPNIVPATAASRYFIRAPKYPDVAYARKRIDDCAKAAALATGTELVIGFSSGIYNKVPNKALALLAAEAIESVAPAQFTDGQIAQMKALGISGIPDKDIKEPTGSQSFGSNPIGDVTWKTPSTTLGVATWAPGTAGHSVEAAVQSGAVYGFEGAVQASKALAAMGIELLTNPESLAAVKSEFAERMKGMPPYEGKAMIPEVAYPEAPGFTVSAVDGMVSVKAAETAFAEAAGDVIVISSMQGDELAAYTLSAQAAAQPEYAFKIPGGVGAGQRLKITFIDASDDSDAWFYGYVHAQ
ncbi:MAG: p-aminobenzoyl-glutamate hydrolase subunit B [Firmicutes bacterium ADurb.BinA052]|nr:MAG: p-aminobenzoyl-glutamate hydrolase subunit B [Firmicutes bacterium ADurb.BinA052]